jgi:large-conductance mechanosensitive channel
MVNYALINFILVMLLLFLVITIFWLLTKRIKNLETMLLKEKQVREEQDRKLYINIKSNFNALLKR